MTYKIQDKNGVIFEGELYEMSLAWDTNWMTNKYFFKRYGKKKDPKWMLKKWDGELELVCILDSLIKYDDCYPDERVKLVKYDTNKTL